MAMRNVAAFFNTTPFSDGFLETWEDPEGRYILMRAYERGYENSEQVMLLRAVVWCAKILDELTTSFVAMFSKKRFSKGDSVGARHNPFLPKQKPVRTAEDDKLAQDRMLDWFGAAGEHLKGKAEA